MSRKHFDNANLAVMGFFIKAKKKSFGSRRIRSLSVYFGLARPLDIASELKNKWIYLFAFVKCGYLSYCKHILVMQDLLLGVSHQFAACWIYIGLAKPSDFSRRLKIS